MRVRQLTPNLIQLTRLRFVNAFLVREDDGFTLVDIGSLEVVEAPGHTPGHVEMVQAIEQAHRALS